MKQKTYLQCLLHFILASMIMLVFSSNGSFQTNDIQPRDVLSDSTYTYTGWVGNPDTLTVYIDDTFSDAEKDSVRVAIQRWNDAGCVPALRPVDEGPANVTVTEGDPGDGNAGLYEWEIDDDGKMTGGTITIRNDPNPGLVETATHELGHALGLDDTDPDDNPSDVMKGSGPSNGSNGGLSEHDLSEMEAAAAAITPVDDYLYAVFPPHAIMPNEATLLNFKTPFYFPPQTEYWVVPIANSKIHVEHVMLLGDNLHVNVFTEPDHWSGKIYLDINFFNTESGIHTRYLGIHYVSQHPVEKLDFFECPMAVAIDGSTVHVHWNFMHNYPFDRPLRSTLSVNGNRFYKVNPSADMPEGYYGDYTITLEPGIHALTLVVDDYQVNLASFTMDVFIVEPPPPLIADLYLRPGEKTNPEPWYAWIGGNEGQTQVQLFAHDPGNQISQVDFYYATDPTDNGWIHFYTDIDGSACIAPGPGTASYGKADGWAGYLQHDMIIQNEPTPLHFMAQIQTFGGVPGDVIEVFSETVLTYDPTPPSSYFLNIEDGYVTDQDFVSVSVMPELANLEYVVFSIADKEAEFQKDIPHANQQDENDCGPYALASCLSYFATNGYPGISGGLDINQLAEALKPYVEFHPDSGTYDTDMAKGARKWIQEKGGGFTVTGPIKYDKFNTTRMRDKFEGDAKFNNIAQNIIPLFRWVDPETGDTLGHFMTLSSLHNDLVEGKRTLDFMDPGTPPGSGYVYGDVDNATGIASDFGNHIPDGAWVESVIMICPDEPASVPPGQGAITQGPDFPPVVIELPVEGKSIVRSRAIDQEGHKSETDIIITRVRPAEYPPGDINVAQGAPPFILEGGIPAGGTYSGPHVVDGIFHPDEAGDFLITYTVVYSSGFVTGCDFVISVIPYDFGDAPDPPYPTLLVNDGARHIIDGVTFLGQSVDPEPDGQQNSDATGDDNDGNNDDDGVIFGEIMVGSAAQVVVTTSVAGFLQGWIDFNADGDWDDPGEQIFIDEYINFGKTVCLNYFVPPDAEPGLTIARFRFSTHPNIGYSGLAPNGEVEDYQVEIIENPDVKWTQNPCEYLTGLHCHDSEIAGFYYFPVLADDWLCNGGPVTEIHWWGNYEVDDMGNEKRFDGIDYFQLGIYIDDPNGCLPFFQPVWSAFAPLANTNETFTGLYDDDNGKIYSYEYVLPVPFNQTAGQRYWLGITAVSNDPVAHPHWRWQESNRSVSTVLCPAASRGFNSPWQHITWPDFPPVRFSEMAFSIVSGEYTPPEPPTATYLRPGEKTNPEPWYAWISDPNGQTQVKLFVNDPDQQIQTVEFFYKTDQTKEEWVLFDTDHDGFSYKAPGPNTGYQGEADGWSGYLPHTMIDQDELFTIEFMAHIITHNDEIIPVDSETTLTYDPTPPSSFYLTVEDGFITDQDFITIQLIPEMANLEYVVFNVSGKADEFQKNIPHTYQGDENSCGPHSLAACLKYFANEGYEGIDGGLDIGELAEALKTHVKNDDKGAYDDDMAEGADEWIKEQGGGFTVTGPVAYEEFNTTRMRKEFEGSALFNGVAQNIIPLFMWIEFNEETQQNDTLGHYMTLSSIHNTLEDGKRKLDFMDPANPGNNYIYGYVDEETGAVSGFGNQIPDGAWVHSVIMICPDEPSPNPGGQGTIAAGPAPEPVEVPMPTEGGVVIRTRAVDQDGHKAERDITGTRVRPAEYPPGDKIVGLGEPPIILEGGIPAGGTYSGPHVVNGVFYPVEMGVFLVTYTVVYPNGFVTECDFIITVIGYDFGDAPDDPYPTLLASNGARHVVGQALYLGQLVDPEPDGQPCPFALGDDQDGTDDEDGIRFLDSFIPGETVTIEATVQGTGYLNAWFDWDANGSWGGPFEHVIVNQSVSTGVHTFDITVPANAAPGFTFARFRLTSQSGLSFAGPAPDGEVEDYRIRINEPMGHKMHYPQYPDPAGWDVYMPTLQHIYQIGDDWLCSETGYVEDIHFWVSWKEDIVPQNLDIEFHVKIFSDIPAGENATGYSMPGTILWQRAFAPGSYVYEEVFEHPQGWLNPFVSDAEYALWDHNTCYKVNILNIPDPFIQEAGTVYWLVIAANMSETLPQIGWKTSLDHFNDVAVWYNPFTVWGWEILIDPVTQHDLSLAFVINGSPLEEPEIPDFLTIDDIIVPAELDTCFNAQKTIYVHNLEILDGGRADLIAGESIIFYPGAKVHHGGEMWARITKDGTFCGYFDRHFLATEPDVDHRPTTSASEVLINDEVQEQPEAFFKVYPNPTRDRFTVELLHYEPGKPVTIEVYSVLGERILYDMVPADQQHMFSLEAQHPGLYLVRVLQGERTGVERLILR